MNRDNRDLSPKRNRAALSLLALSDKASPPSLMTRGMQLPLQEANQLYADKGLPPGYDCFWVKRKQGKLIAVCNNLRAVEHDSQTWFASPMQAARDFMQWEFAERERRLNILKSSRSYAQAQRTASWNGLWYNGDTVGEQDPFTAIYGLERPIDPLHEHLLQRFEPLELGWTMRPQARPPEGSPSKSNEAWFEPLPGSRVESTNDLLLVFSSRADQVECIAEPSQAADLPLGKLFYNPDDSAWQRVERVVAKRPRVTGRDPKVLLPSTSPKGCGPLEVLTRRQRQGKRGPVWNAQIRAQQRGSSNYHYFEKADSVHNGKLLPIEYNGKPISKPKHFHSTDSPMPI